MTPLSPYLFILVSKVMVSMFRKAENHGLMDAIEAEKGQIRLKHL